MRLLRFLHSTTAAAVLYLEPISQIPNESNRTPADLIGYQITHWIKLPQIL
jgi:hypothetical protein